jgi:hypothetical protein
MFFEDLPKILRVLGFYIAYDEKVFLKLLQVFNKNMNTKHAAIISKITGEVLLPALSLTSCNYVLENAIWAILKQSNFRDRYNYYCNFWSRSYLSHPCLL